VNWGSVPEKNLLHSLYRGVVVWYDNVRCRTGYWSTVAMYSGVLCKRATASKDRDTILNV
jgi:hypothetical protein